MHRTLTLLTAAFLLLSSCQGMVAHRLSDGDVDTLKPGMTVSEVRAILGRPWKLILHPLSNGKKETHRYLLKREGLGEPIIRRDHGGIVSESYVASQYREIELVFVDGKLVGDRR